MGMDQLRQALSGHFTERPAKEDPLPDPLRSPWGEQLRRMLDRGALPAQPSLGQLRQRSDALVKELKNAGRRREGEELQKLRDAFEKEREKIAWGLIKEAFEAQQLPDRAWRALKQAPDADPVAILQRLRKAKDALAGAGADRVRDTLLGKSVVS